MELVSIIIPTYNRGDLILDTLDSIKEQSYKNLEIILIDDHSTDSSEKIIKEYINNSQLNIVYYKNRGKGACAARNMGIDLSHSNFIQFFDDDDLMDRDFIKARLERIISEKLDFAACNFLRFDNETNRIVDEVVCSNIPDNIVSHIYYSRLPTPCFLFTRKAVGKLGYWNEKVKRLQDMAYYHRIYLYGLNGAWMDVNLFRSRKHSVTISKMYGNDSMIYALNCIQKEWKGKNAALSNLLTYKKRKFASKFKETDYKRWIKFNIYEFLSNPLSFFSYFLKKRYIYKSENELFHNLI